MTADVVTRFREQLADAPEPRRVPRALPVAAMAGLATTLAVVLVLASGDSRSALAVTYEGDWIELKLTDPDASPAQMTRELEDAGIRGRVVAVPVREDQVGSWIAFAEVAQRERCIASGDTPRREEEVRLGTIQHNRTAIRISATRVRESSGQFVFIAGRAARPDEQPRGEEAAGAVIDELIGPAPRHLPAC